MANGRVIEHRLIVQKGHPMTSTDCAFLRRSAIIAAVVLSIFLLVLTVRQLSAYEAALAATVSI